MAKPVRKLNRKASQEDGVGGRGHDRGPRIEEDEWAEAERERKDEIARRARLQRSVGNKLNDRLRARGVKPPASY